MYVTYICVLPIRGWLLVLVERKSEGRKFTGLGTMSGGKAEWNDDYQPFFFFFVL